VLLLDRSFIIYLFKLKQRQNNQKKTVIVTTGHNYHRTEQALRADALRFDGNHAVVAVCQLPVQD
jgi:hypothetical protein